MSPSIAKHLTCLCNSAPPKAPKDSKITIFLLNVPKPQTTHVATIQTLHRIIQSVGATGGVYKGQGRSQRELMCCGHETHCSTRVSPNRPNRPSRRYQRPRFSPRCISLQPEGISLDSTLKKESIPIGIEPKYSLSKKL
ncbi:hypothetical protein YC2023_004407 [Brassica napus]